MTKFRREFVQVISVKKLQAAFVVNGQRRPQGYLAETSRPMLLLTFSPGGLIRAPQLAWAKQNISNLTVRFIGPGAAIRAILDFLDFPDIVTIRFLA